MKSTEENILTLEMLEAILETQDMPQAKQLLEELHPADIAEIFEKLHLEQVKQLWTLLSGERAADVLMELDEGDRKKLLEELTAENIAKAYVENLDSDDATDLLQELPGKRKEEVLHHIDDKEHAGEIVDLLNYEEGTAGSLMGVEFIKVYRNWTVRTCLNSISQQAEGIDEIYYIYVVNDDEELEGLLSLKKLILYPTSTKITDVLFQDVIAAKTSTPLEQVAQLIQKYDLVAIPVVDEIGRLKGRITIDDVVDFITEEADKDYQMAAGVSADTDVTDSAWSGVKARLPWLLIGLFGEIIVSIVMDANAQQLARNVAIAIFIPLIGAIGGSVGVQSTTLMIKSMANGSYFRYSVGKQIGKELGTALMIAIALSGLMLSYNLLFSSHGLSLTIAVSVALFTVIINAAFFGTVFPIVLQKLKFDPAVATGPFITTMNDIYGMSIYMLVVHLML